MPANIAEGVGRDSDAELLRFVRIALGSLNELETLITISGDLTFTKAEGAEDMEILTRDLGVKLRNFATRLEQSMPARKLVREDLAAYDAD